MKIKGKEIALGAVFVAGSIFAANEEMSERYERVSQDGEQNNTEVKAEVKKPDWTDGYSYSPEPK